MLAVPFVLKVWHIPDQHTQSLIAYVVPQLKLKGKNLIGSVFALAARLDGT